MISQSVYFISDLHLADECQPAYKLFIQFTEEVLAPKDTLYILGDFFDTWIGDDNRTTFNDAVAKQLATLAKDKNIQVFLMRGNRDFLMQRKFANRAKSLMLPEPTTIVLDNKPVLLCHGDTLCTDDTAYLKYRRKARNPIIQRIYLALPLSWRRKIADNLRRKSKNAVSTKQVEILDTNEGAVQQEMQRYNVTTLIHGHTHRPKHHTHQLGDIHADRYVLGDWHQSAQVLRYREGTFELITLALKSH